MRRNGKQLAERIEALATFMEAVMRLLPCSERIAYASDEKGVEVLLDDAVILTVTCSEKHMSAVTPEGVFVKSPRASKAAMDDCAAMLALHLERCRSPL